MQSKLKIIGLLLIAGFVALLVGQRAMTRFGDDPAYLPFIGRTDRPTPEPTDEPHPSPTPETTPIPAGIFFDSFDGEPVMPLPWRPDNWDVTVHSRSREHIYELAEMQAGHSEHCDPPPTNHPITAYEDAVFQCRNHMMTAINEGGYGAIYLTPNHLVDFSGGEAVVRFDLSTERTSSRDWVDLWLTPYEAHLQLPLADWLPDLSGEPRRGIKIEMDSFEGQTIFKGEIIRDHQAEQVDSDTLTGYESFLLPSAAERTTFELRISQTHLQFGMPAYDFWWIDTDISALGWERGVVQFGHHSYNPTKDCNDCGPNTWHWDNVYIEPATPFTMIHADRRYVDPTTAQSVNFGTAAPPNAYLRFAAIGNHLEVSFDGGTTWEAAQIQSQERYVEEAFWSYWTPVPAGTSSVAFRGEDWWGGNWHVRDITIWSLAADTSTTTTDLSATTTLTTPVAYAPLTLNEDETAIEADIIVDTTAAGITIDPRILGSNLPVWLNPDRFADLTFRTRIQAAGLTVLRFPGGSWSNAYDWLACERGQGIDDEAICYWPWAARPTDFIDFLQATGIEGMVTANINGTAQEAAAWVAFFNGSVDDERPLGVDVRGRDWGTVGDWARLRSDNGNPDPLPVRYWEVGNEVYGGKEGSGRDCLPWGWEDVWTCDGTEYSNGIGSGDGRHEGYLEFRAAMQAVDPTIQVGAVGVAGQGEWSNWGNEVLSAAGTEMEFYVIHNYGFNERPATYADVLAQPQTMWSRIVSDFAAAVDDHAGGRPIPLALTEYNLFAVEGQDSEGWMSHAVNALYLADTIGQLIQNGFVMANQWDVAHGEGLDAPGYGLMQAATYFRSPQYYAFPLWAHFGNEMLPLRSKLAADTTLSLYAGRNGANELTLLAINKTGEPISTTIQFAGADSIVSGSVDVVEAAALDATSVTFNGLTDPADDLSDAPAAPITNLSNPLHHTFSPYSITLLRLHVAGSQ